MQNNKDIINQINKISNIFQTGNFIDAISKSKKLLHQIPNNEFLLNIIGMSYLNLGKLDDAKNLFQKAIKLNPKITSFKNNYANVLKSLDQIEEAEKILNELIDTNPSYINALNNLANLKKNIKKFDEAIDLFKRALKIDPKNIAILYNLALCYRSIRKYNLVMECAETINKIDQSFTLADKIISEIQDYKDESGNRHLSKMEKKIKELKLSNEQKIPLYFSLGKAYEDKEEYELSFENYKKGNKFRRDLLNYNFNDEKEKLFAIKEIFKKPEKIKLKKENFKKKIIFICGMPRSGTTLLEQIISAHSKVDSLGETEFLNKVISKLDFRKLKLSNLITSINEKGNFIYDDYVKLLENLNFNNETLTDKSLLNFQLIGFIKIFFPNSKVLVLKRDFNNNFLSIFKNDLLGPQLRWTFDAKEISDYYKLFSEYIDLWNKIFPDFLMEIDYEDLVKNTQTVAKNTLNFCDLSWEEACLDYYKKNKSSIDTASANQANKPVYKSSLNKFENYKRFFNFE